MNDSEQSCTKVSLVIPVYNAEKYLRFCVDSVLAQTLPEIEVICVNDGSADRSLAILREYEANDPRVRVIDQKNGGVASARNAGIRAAQGKYIYFVDADDWIDHELCEKCYYCAEQADADITFLYFTRFADKTACPPVFRLPILLSNDLSAKIDYTKRFGFAVYMRFFRADFLREHSLFIPPYRVAEDRLFAWQTLILADKMTVCPEILYFYRDNDESVTCSFGEGFLDVVPVFEDLEKFLKKHGVFEEFQNAFYQQKFHACFSNYALISKRLRPTLLQRIKNAYTKEDRSNLYKHKIPWHIRMFFSSLDGFRPMNYMGTIVFLYLYRSYIYWTGLHHKARKSEQKLSQVPVDVKKRDQELCQMLALLRKEVYFLKKDRENDSRPT